MELSLGLKLLRVGNLPMIVNSTLLMKKYLISRKNYFEKVLAERLVLDNQQLDFLDNMEKLISDTYN